MKDWPKVAALMNVRVQLDSLIATKGTGFARYADTIERLSRDGTMESDLSDLLILEEDHTRIYYAPFDWINTAARVVIVGITPGRDSMMAGISSAGAALREGASLEEAARLGKRAGSFSNMKRLMSRMLDEIGLHSALGLRSSEELFGSRYDLLHPTSCIRYPVFAWNAKKSIWDNYNGHSPDLLKWGVALRFIDELLADELNQFPDALIVPCGEAVSAALERLESRGLVEGRHCLFGFPHASGNNGYRALYFSQRKSALAKKVEDWARHIT